MYLGKKRGVSGRRFVGIDESNHGKYPEIYVAVFSNNKRDLERKHHISKGRSQKTVCNILGDRYFKYILIPKEYKDILKNNDNIVVMVLSEFIKDFNNLDLVLVDGHLKESTIEKVKDSLWPKRCPEIVGEAKADSRYPIVNLADRVANLIFRYHTRENTSKKEDENYISHMITPKIEDYANLIHDEVIDF